MRRCVVFFVSVMAVCVAAPAFGQGATLTGRVRDVQGAAVPGAEIRVAREDAGVSRSVTSGDTGEYRIGDLPAGVFVVDVAKSGFRRRTDVVTVAAGAGVMLDVDLEVAGIDDTVVVTAAG